MCSRVKSAMALVSLSFLRVKRIKEASEARRWQQKKEESICKGEGWRTMTKLWSEASLEQVGRFKGGGQPVLRGKPGPCVAPHVTWLLLQCRLVPTNDFARCQGRLWFSYKVTFIQSSV